MSALMSAQYVTSGISLVAFAIAAILIGYRYRLKQNEKSIEKARPQDRPKVIQELAQKFGADIGRLPSTDQVLIISKIIHTRRMYAVFGLILAIIVAVIALIFIIYNTDERSVSEKSVGPITLATGDTKSEGIRLTRDGTVHVFGNNVAPDWTNNESARKLFIAQRRAKPEIYVTICNSKNDEQCAKFSCQLTTNRTCSRELRAGTGTITFFNFVENPSMSLSATINY